jgi:hypothetical protein
VRLSSWRGANTDTHTDADADAHADAHAGPLLYVGRRR